MYFLQGDTPVQRAKGSDLYITPKLEIVEPKNLVEISKDEYMKKLAEHLPVIDFLNKNKNLLK